MEVFLNKNAMSDDKTIPAFEPQPDNDKQVAEEIEKSIEGIDFSKSDSGVPLPTKPESIDPKTDGAQCRDSTEPFG